MIDFNKSIKGGDALSEYGYAGKILKIDLTSRNITKLDTSAYSARFLGGRGIAEKIYWDGNPPHAKAFDPQNQLIMVSGPVAGFTRFAGSRVQICGKSPLNDPESFSYASLGGSWGSWLKYAGYDGLVITGKAEHPVYLYLDSEGRVEIRDAAHLWGKLTHDTQDMLQAELGNEVKTLEIGPAAENRVYYATGLSTQNSTFGGGLAGVMGSKNLKAIAVEVKEKKNPLAANPERLQNLAKEVLDIYARNWEDGRQKTLTGKVSACFGCVRGCSRRSYEAENGRKFRSYCQSTMVYLKFALKYSSSEGLEVSRMATRLCDKYGLDSMIMQPLIEWLYLCYEQGILSENETGLPLSKIGSAGFFETLVRMISYREGFGDILANGTIRAAEYVGKGSQKLLSKAGVATRTSEKSDYDARLIIPNALIYATEPKKSILLLHAIAQPLRRWVNWHNKLDGSYLSSEVYQDIAEKYWGGKQAVNFCTYEGKAQAARMIQDYGYVKECLILCDATWPIYQVSSVDDSVVCGTLESRIASAITGRDMDEKELLKIGERVFNLQRAIMLREGWGGRKGDRLLDYLHEEPLESVYWSADCLVPDKNGEVVSRKGSVVDRNEFENLKSEYYTLRGWDVESGTPSRSKLADLDLNDIANEMSGLKK
jgi:aldehyde:ferredoxin oxidoreductase